MKKNAVKILNLLIGRKLEACWFALLLTGRNKEIINLFNYTSDRRAMKKI